MTKSELVEAIATHTNTSNTETERMLNAFVTVIKEKVQEGNKVVVYGLGTFEKIRKSARVGVNPATNQKIQIAAKNAPKFKFSKAFKDAINNK